MWRAFFMLSVWGMSLTDYFQQRARGVALIKEADGLAKSDLLAMGADPDEADQMLALHQTYWGPTKFTGLQRTARQTNHGLGVLLRIEKHVRRTRNQRDAWRLRAELCQLPAGDIDGVARQRLAELYPPKEEEDGIKIRRGRKWKLIATGSSKDIGDIYEHLDGSLQSLLDAFFSSTARPEVTTNVIVHLDELDQILRGDGDDIQLRLTNGTTMTGAQYLASRFSSFGFAAIFHPEEGPVDLYRSERFASDKQRHLCALENPTCAWPGCNCPATESQIHHIQAFVAGGLTNIKNLVTLCPYHNGINADDPFGPNPRGRIARISGATSFCPPFGGPPIPTGIHADLAAA